MKKFLLFLILPIFLFSQQWTSPDNTFVNQAQFQWSRYLSKLVPAKGLALLINPGAQMIEKAQGNKRFPPLSLGSEIVANGDFHDFTFDYSSIGEENPFYTSDFSVDEDGWTGQYGIVVGNVDGIDGQDDVLKFTIDTNNNYHWAQYNFSGVSHLQYYKYTGKVYIPSTNTDVAQIRIYNGSSSNGYKVIATTDAWTNFEVEIKTTSGNRIYIECQKSDGTRVFTGNGTDVFYVKDIQVQRVGMVSHWIFDSYYHAQEGTGKTILQDLSGNAHDLTASSGFDYSNQLTGSNPAYKNGNALQFDGVDDYFYIPAASATAFNPGTGDFSLSVWVKANTVPATDVPIFSKGGFASQNGFMFRRRYISNYYEIYVPAADGSTYWVAKTNLYAPDGQWNHFVFSFDRDGEQAVYVNGSKIWSQTVTNTNDNSNSYDLKIGNVNLSINIAEVAYFNRALSATEVKELYGKAKGWTWDGTGSISNSNFNQVISGGGTLTQTVTTTDNTLYKEKLTSTSGDSINYFGETTSHTVTLTDGTWTNASVKEVTNVSEQPNLVEDFSQGGAKYGSDLGVTGWQNESGYLFETFTTSGGSITRATDTDGNGRCRTTNIYTVNAGEIYRIKFTNLTMYSSGTLTVLFKDFATNISTISTTNGNDVYIKITISSTNAQLMLIGNNQDFSLDKVEIQKVTNGNHGLIQGSLETAQPVHPYAWEFDGVDDYERYVSNLITERKSVILWAWINVIDPSSYPAIWCDTDDLDSYKGIKFFVNTNGVLRSYYGDGTSVNSFVGVTSVADGKWHFVCLVIDTGNDKRQFWIDGQLDAETALPSVYAIPTSGLVFGSWKYGSVSGLFNNLAGLRGIYYFNGQNGWPSSLPDGYKTTYIQKIYNNTKRYYQPENISVSSIYQYNKLPIDCQDLIFLTFLNQGKEIRKWLEFVH